MSLETDLYDDGEVTYAMRDCFIRHVQSEYISGYQSVNIMVGPTRDLNYRIVPGDSEPCEQNQTCSKKPKPTGSVHVSQTCDGIQ